MAELPDHLGLLFLGGVIQLFGLHDAGQGQQGAEIDGELEVVGLDARDL